MKKHIIGLTFFSFIIAITAAGFAFFSPLKISQVLKPSYISQAEKSSVIQNEYKQSVVQAVYNTKSKTLVWKLDSFDSHKLKALHWFVESESGVQEYLTFYCQDSSGEFEVSPQTEIGKMLKTFPKANQYLIAEKYRGNVISDGANSPFAFDASKAFAVTIDYGK